MKRLTRPMSGFLLATVVVTGFLVRLSVSSHEGLFSDIDLNERWGKSAIVLGFAHSYERQLEDGILPNHAPLSVGSFTLMAGVYRAAFSPQMELHTLTYRILIKLPAIIADMILVVLLGWYFRRWGSAEQGLLVSTAYAFHPAVIYDSAIWGQTDALPVLFIVLGIAALTQRKLWITGVWSALAIMSKAQAIAILPALVLPAFRFPRTAIRAVISGSVIVFLIFLPFFAAHTADTLWNVYTHSVGYYPILSSAAYNFWWALFLDSTSTTSSTDLLFGIMSYRTIGVLLYVSFTLWGIAALRHWWMSDTEAERWNGLLLAAAIASYAFFLFNTEMHERYLFPFMALGLPMLFQGRRMAVTYCCSSLLFLLNMMGYLQFGVIDRALFSTFPAFDGVIAWGHLTCFGVLIAWVAGNRPRRITFMRKLVSRLALKPWRA